jgi:transposase
MTTNEMIKPISSFTLKAEDYIALQAFSDHRYRGHEWRRARALIWLADGESVAEVANRLNVSRQTVYNWVERFQVREDLALNDRLRDADRSGRPCTVQGIIDPLIDEVIDDDPRTLGYNTMIWTAALLRQYLHEQHEVVVSEKSVRRAVKRLRVRWKRPRYQLARRSATWRQAKGG